MLLIGGVKTSEVIIRKASRWHPMLRLVLEEFGGTDRQFGYGQDICDFGFF
jgi:hypothetical protein